MGETPVGERLVAIEKDIEAIHSRIDAESEKIKDLVEARKQRSTREWGLIMAGVGLVGTILAQAMGLLK